MTTVTKRDLEIAAHNWKIQAENAQAREERLLHALNLLVNDSIEWYAERNTSDGAIHKFGVAVVFDLPIRNPMARAVRHADVEHLPMLFWQTIWPAGHRYISAYGTGDFATLKDPQGWESTENVSELLAMLEPVLNQFEEARKRYVSRRTGPVVH